MPVSVANSQVIYDALKACDVKIISALPETWLVHLIRMADDDPEVTLVRVAKEEEAIGISAGAHLAGVNSALLMQNHGFLAAINPIVSLALLYKIPLLMLISYRGHMGERDPWQTQGGMVTEPLLRTLGIPVWHLLNPYDAQRRIKDAQTLRIALAGRRALDPRADVGGVAMLRVDALQAIYPEVKDRIVVTIMGAVAAELYTIGHRPNFFYLEHAMGLASSMGLGIALAMPRHKVVVIDGDGSLLMNLGTLSTMARYRPGNLVHIVFDNASLLSVGGFPTATATGTDLAGVARACAIPEVVEAHTPERLKQAVAGALAGGMLTTIVSKVEAIGPKSFHMDLPLLENRFQFKRALEALR
jgi:sulfopyruvate decarboxylase alpha subunit